MKDQDKQSVVYIGEITTELAKMARTINQPALALLLEMVALEAGLACDKPKK
jgi:hypothetical protein